MHKYKVCIYVICKNEEKFIDRFMDCTNEADLVVAMDTGSTDNTVQKLKNRGAYVYSMKPELFRFDHARNECLKHIPDDVDICVAADLDEVIRPGWRDALEKAWKDDTTRGYYLFNWCLDDEGNPIIQFYQERIHSRHDYTWIFPTHEVLKYIGKDHEKRVFIDGMVYDHFPDRKKNRSFNLPLLKLAVEEYPDDPRNYHYLGREYMYAEMWDDCIKTLNFYLNMPNAFYTEERCASMRFISRAYKAKNDFYNARVWLYKAITECPYLREPYVEMAQLCFLLNDWLGVCFFANTALSIPNKSFSYANELFAWDATPYDLSALGYYYLGLPEKAIEFSKKALELDPDNERLQKNHKFYTGKIKPENKINEVKTKANKTKEKDK